MRLWRHSARRGIWPVMFVGLVMMLLGAAAGRPAEGTRFVATDVWVETSGTPLGAYQVELTAPGAMVVGIEGGADAAFSAAPYYDPAALQGSHKVIIAAFSTRDVRELPAGRVRVARVHWALAGGGPGVGRDAKSEIAAKLVVATDAQGRTIDRARLDVRPFEGAQP